ncbi:MAG: type II toxin-antitoxin system RelE/ParE family toxin [Gammaproteobacteria bacterium]|nr:type II toxin-antitoxin system RelE/ParE family toxin [Gammaproteobacteria bacterium]
MGWRIELARSVEKDLKKIDPADAGRIVRVLRERIAPLDDPRSIGEPLHGPELGRFWKYRVGRYRIIASIEDERLVILVVRIGHRQNIHR